ncbi:hypothetical protein [Ruania albidiflava]|uniref:hypothetical protein n=1 Tax=Ruania albidiflava TaxID=366586 RepID=UPI0003B3135C|nr:hypothetical protein [Ruania albidiflava]
MGRNFSSGLLAGVTAATIWMAIALWQGMPTETVGMWALVFLIGTTLISTIISGIIVKGAGGTAAEAERS